MVNLVVLVRMRKEAGGVRLFLEEMAARLWPGRAVALQWGNGAEGCCPHRRRIHLRSTEKEHHSYCEGPDQNPYTKG